MAMEAMSSGSSMGKNSVEQKKEALDYGYNFYATQTWSDVPAEDGRCIQMAWMRGGEFPDMPFNQQLTFPCELSLRTVGDKMILCRYPVQEIKSYTARKSPGKTLRLAMVTIF